MGGTVDRQVDKRGTVKQVHKPCQQQMISFSANATTSGSPSSSGSTQNSSPDSLAPQSESPPSPQPVPNQDDDVSLADVLCDLMWDSLEKTSNAVNIYKTVFPTYDAVRDAIVKAQFRVCDSLLCALLGEDPPERTSTCERSSGRQSRSPRRHPVFGFFSFFWRLHWMPGSGLSIGDCTRSPRLR